MKFSLGLIAVVSLFAVMGMVYAVPLVSASTPVYIINVNPGTCNPSTDVCSTAIGTDLFTPSTTDLTVTSVGLSLTPYNAPGGIAQSGVSTCTVSGGVNTCTAVALTVNVGGTWKLVTNFNGNNGVFSTTQTVQTAVVATPEFPAGTILAILAPIGALIGYGKFGKSTIRKPV